MGVHHDPLPCRPPRFKNFLHMPERVMLARVLRQAVLELLFAPLGPPENLKSRVSVCLFSLLSWAVTGRTMAIRRLKRRTFIAAFGSAAVWPVVAGAQQPEKTRLVGILHQPSRLAYASQQQSAPRKLAPLGARSRLAPLGVTRP
jgi:hypothetical protein